MDQQNTIAVALILLYFIILFTRPKPIVLSFFSGAMGLDIGLENSGFDIKLACDIDKHCQDTIRSRR